MRGWCPKHRAHAQGHYALRAPGEVEDFLASMPENAEATLEAAVSKMNKRQLRQMHKGMMKGKMQARRSSLRKAGKQVLDFS